MCEMRDDIFQIKEELRNVVRYRLVSWDFNVYTDSIRLGGHYGGTEKFLAHL